MNRIDEALEQCVWRWAKDGVAQSAARRVEQIHGLVRALEGAWRRATTIETLDELRAIEPPAPRSLNGALIRPANSATLGSVFELGCDGQWNDLDRPYAPPMPPDDVPLPAILIWEPEADDPEPPTPDRASTGVAPR